MNTCLISQLAGSVIVALIASLTAANAQACLDLNGPFLRYGHELIALEPAFEDYAYMLEEACAVWGLEYDSGCNINPLMGEIHLNAYATTCGMNSKASKVIIYDRRLSSIVGGDGAQAIIAHELAHHVCGHLEADLRDEVTGNLELEADAFAGATMRKLGYSLEVALSYAPVLSEQATISHPDSTARIRALRDGWENPETAGNCIAGAQVVRSSARPIPRPSPAGR